MNKQTEITNVLFRFLKKLHGGHLMRKSGTRWPCSNSLTRFAGPGTEKGPIQIRHIGCWWHIPSPMVCLQGRSSLCHSVRQCERDLRALWGVCSVVPLVRQAVWRHHENLLYHQWRPGKSLYNRLTVGLLRNVCILLSLLVISLSNTRVNYMANIWTPQH